MCVCYCNVLLQYSTALLLCVCYGNVLLQYSTALQLCVCVTVMCCYHTVQYSVTVMYVLL